MERSPERVGADVESPALNDQRTHRRIKPPRGLDFSGSGGDAVVHADAISNRSGAGEKRSCRGEGHVDVEPSTSSWKVFVMGLDRAFDQSYARRCTGGFRPKRGSSGESENRTPRPPGRLEWRGAIVPAASRR